MSTTNVSNMVSICRELSVCPHYRPTPRQRCNIEQLLRADDAGDSDGAADWAEYIDKQFRYENDDFRTAMTVYLLRCRVAMAVVISILNESAPPPLQIKSHDLSFQLSYGNTDQQREAFGYREGTSGISPEEMVEHRELVEEHTFHELLLDRAYVTRRMQAACSDINLTDRLVQECDWDGLLALLDQDQMVCDYLLPWLLHTSEPSSAFFQQGRQIIMERINQLRSIASDHSNSTDPPPAYSRVDPNATSTLPSLPEALMNFPVINIMVLGLQRIVDRTPPN